jgi:hypothetical protein
VLHIMRLRVVVLLAWLLLLLLLLPPLPGRVRLGGPTHSSSIAGFAGLCCALPCRAVLHCCCVGLLLPFEQQKDRSDGFDIFRCYHLAHQLSTLHTANFCASGDEASARGADDARAAACSP